MMRSMYSGVSGLRVHQTKMDVISNNISNINTVGFKRSSVSFKDSFNQTLTSASSANADRGGINPQQIGMGANVGAIVTVMGQGAAQRTDYGSDIMIDGEGFFIVKNSNGFSFTRAGVFEFDAKGNLVDPNGYSVCGWKADPDTGKIVQDNVTPINIYEGDNLYVPAKPTENIEFTGNFNATTNPEQLNSFSFYDTLGNRYTMNIKFSRKTAEGTPLPANAWRIEFPTVAIDEQNNVTQLPTTGDNPPAPTHYELTVNGKDKVYLPVADIALDGAHLHFDEATGKFQGIGDAGGASEPPQKVLAFAGPIPLQNLIKLEGKGEGASQAPANLGGIQLQPLKIDFSTVTQFNSKVTVTSETKDGNEAGNMAGFNIDSNGIIRGTYTNGQTRILAQIPLATFKNPAGLEKVGNNLFKETGNSSEFDGIGTEASALNSKLQSGALEMANVDLSYEFSEMITTQRGFQANSRIITTSDEMIQELVNLKR